MTRSRRNTLIFVLTALAVVALDQGLKALVVALVEPGDSFDLIPGALTIIHSTNTGAAFGLLRGSGQIVLLASLVVVVVMMAWFFYTRKHMGAGSFVGLGLIIGGALGNLLDRVFRGRVVDFIDIHWWPVFNVADMAIVAGVIIVLVGYARELWREEGSAGP